MLKAATAISGNRLPSLKLMMGSRSSDPRFRVGNHRWWKLKHKINSWSRFPALRIPQTLQTLSLAKLPVLFIDAATTTIQPKLKGPRIGRGWKLQQTKTNWYYPAVAAGLKIARCLQLIQKVDSPALMPRSENTFRNYQDLVQGLQISTIRRTQNQKTLFCRKF